MGVSTAYTILGERVAPLLVRAYLARTGVSGQQTDADLPCYGSNVFEPSDDEVDRGAHGPFDDQSYRRDPVSWASMHRAALAAGATGLAAGAAAVVGLLRR